MIAQISVALVLAGQPVSEPHSSAPPSVGSADTTFAVTPGVSLEMLNTSGRITITTWPRSEVRIKSVGDADNPVEIRYSGTIVHVRTRSERGVARPSVVIGPGTTVTAQVEVLRRGGPLPRVDYDITVPAGMPLDVAGIYSDVSISGTQAPVHATAIHGDLTVRGGRGTIVLENLEGRIRLDGASGAIAINAPNNSVNIANSTGPATIASVNGGIVVEASSLSALAARTYNGNILYSGSLKDGGLYTLSTFNGTATLRPLSGSSATIEAATVKSNIIASEGGRTLAGGTPKRKSIVIGAGLAHVKMQTFEGDIQIIPDTDTRK
jgi:hypothetical protein